MTDLSDISGAGEGEWTAPYGPLAFFLDLKPEVSDFRADVLAALSGPTRRVSPKYLYDARGSALFERITTVDAYYPTRTERAIVEASAAEIAEALGPGRGVIEYGAGAADKIARLLALLDDPRAYVATDISRDHLIENASAFARTTPLPVGAVCADFMKTVALPAPAAALAPRWVGFFPGSTLGNLTDAEATAFLAAAAETLGPEGAMLIGVDLEKDPATLRRAYDDPDGVTAEFNLNLLTRLREELGAEVDEGDFRHEARVLDDPQRVEMHLTARRQTEVAIGERVFAFEPGDSLHTETSQKYTLGRLDSILAGTPWRRSETWTDDARTFAVAALQRR